MNHSQQLGKVILAITLGFVWITSNFITFHYVCDYPEHGPSFYGFPFVQQTNSTWVNSFSGELYVFGLLGNLALWSLVFYGLIWLINDVLGKKIRKLLFIVGVLTFVLSIIFISLYFQVYEWRFEWSHDDFKLNYYQTDITCERTLRIFD